MIYRIKCRAYHKYIAEDKMKIGCPKEIKNQEYRVGLIPATVKELTKLGHSVFIQESAGIGSGFLDSEYESAGAQILSNAAKVFSNSEMIIKVKEPQAEERKLLKSDQILFTYLHLAPDPVQSKELIDSKVTAIAYETVTDGRGGLPLLAPMSEVAGKLAPQVGSWTLQKANGGRGVLMGGVPGVLPANILVIGGGVVGTNSARVACGMGANVTILDRSIERMKEIDDCFGPQIKTAYSSIETINELSKQADMIIGAVLIPGAKAPKLIERSQLSRMKKGAVLVDVAIDQGGCFETSKPTTHDDPIYEVDGIVHYCVANMPGAVARTSTMALNNATMPFIMQIAEKGWAKACLDNPHLKNGLNVHKGKIAYEAVASSLGEKYYSPDELIHNE